MEWRLTHFFYSPEAAVVQLFEEVKRHKPSVIYIPNVNVWYSTLAEPVIKTFLGLLRGLAPTEPVLLLGTMSSENEDTGADSLMIRDLFGYSTRNQFLLKRPDEESRIEFFGRILELISKSPAEFPDPDRRKRRKLEQLPIAPTTAQQHSPTPSTTTTHKRHNPPPTAHNLRTPGCLVPQPLSFGGGRGPGCGCSRVGEEGLCEVRARRIP